MPIERQKLTRSFLMNLPEFTFICSGICKSPNEPAFADYVSAPELRAAQWKTIRKLGAAQRQCLVFVNKQ